MICQSIADVFEDIHKQATILTGGNLSLLTKSELLPVWVACQMNAKEKMRDDHRVLANDSAIMWQKVIAHIDAVHSDEPQPIPNYFMRCGGSEAVQRLIDSPSPFLCGKAIYNPAHLLTPKFGLNDLCMGRKCVLKGVRIDTIAFDWLESILTIVFTACVYRRWSQCLDHQHYHWKNSHWS
jgi:hypothetical protein